MADQPTDDELAQLLDRIEHRLLEEPDSMRRLQELAFEVGFTLMASGEEPAVRMLVDAGLDEDFARWAVRDIVATVIP